MFEQSGGGLRAARERLRADQSRGASTLRECAQQEVWGVLVIGCGVAGASAAWQLANCARPPSSILVVDHGSLGAGTHERYVAPPKLPPARPSASAAPAAAPRATTAGGSTSAAGGVTAEGEEDIGEENVYHAGNSGGVVFSEPHFAGPLCTKYILTLFNIPTPEFVEHHGVSGARGYLRLAARGVALQKALCRALIPHAERDGILEETGSMMLGMPGAEEAAMREEFAALRELGCDVEWLGAAAVSALHGPDAGFSCGILFPHDARIDSLAYVRALVAGAVACRRSRVRAVAHAPTLVDVRDVPGGEGGVVATFADGTRVRAGHAVVATNGLFLDMHLAGLLVPRWSYFVALPHPHDPLVSAAPAPAAAPAPTAAPAAATAPAATGTDTAAAAAAASLQLLQQRSAPLLMGGLSSHCYFTYGFTYDWCVTRGVLRISGLDHISALKPPRARHQSALLKDWVLAKYPYMRALLPPATAAAGDEIRGRFVYGVWAETPDALPIVGVPREGSRVCYVVGCNAAGQSVLTYAASIVPGLLGFDDLSDEDVAHARLIAMTRFKTQQAYLRGKL